MDHLSDVQRRRVARRSDVVTRWPNGTLLRPTPRCAAAMLAASLLAMPAAPLARRCVATVTTSLAAVELCDEDVAMRCSAQSDAGSAADPEWEAVLAQLLAEEAEEEELCCRFERRGDELRRRVGQLQ